MDADRSALLAEQRAARGRRLRRALAASWFVARAAFLLLVAWIGWRVYVRVFTAENVLAFFHFCLVGALGGTVAWLLLRHLFESEEPGAPPSRRLAGFAFLLPALALIPAAFWLTWFSFLARDLPATVNVRGGPAIDLQAGLQAALPNALYGPAVAVLLFAGHALVRARRPGTDPLLYAAVALLLGLGLVLLYRLAPDEAAAARNPVLAGLFRRQLAWAAVAMAALIVVARGLRPGHLHRLARLKYLWVLLTVLLIAATALFGHEINERRLWIRVGPVTVQSIEIAKLLLVVFVAAYLAGEATYLEVPAVRRLRLPPLRAALAFAGLWLVAVLPVVLQRDFGPAFLLVGLFLVAFWVGTGSVTLSLAGLAAAAGAGFVSYRLGVPSMVRRRVDMWLDPFTHSEPMARAFWAQTSGGLWGVGLAQGTSPAIPIVHSDFSFVLVCEELGLVGAAAVLGLHVLFALRGARIAARQPDRFRRLLVATLSALFAIQVLVIVGGNSGLLPMTGITLPFVSYGGTSLVLSMVAAGVLLALGDPGFDAGEARR